MLYISSASRRPRCLVCLKVISFTVCLIHPVYLSAALSSAILPAYVHAAFLIMERIPVTVHQTVLACVLFVTLTALVPLRWQRIRLNSFRDQSPALITICKCISDIALVVLISQNVSTEVDHGR